MFTLNSAKPTTDNKYLVEASCLSTDTKPTDGIANGSLCLEMDTGDFYGFDADAGDWNKIGE